MDIRKLTIVVLLIFLSTTTAHSGIPKVIPNKTYTLKTEKLEVFVVTKQLVGIFGKFDWSICNNKLFKSELKYYFKSPLEDRLKHWFRGAARIVAADHQNVETFLSEETNKEIQVELSSITKPKGICVEKLKIYSYNKSSQPML